MKTVVKAITGCLGVVLILASVYWWQNEQKLKKRSAEEREALNNQDKLVAGFHEKLNQSRDQEDIESLMAEYKILPIKAQAAFKPALELKKTIFTFEKAEKELLRAMQFSTVINGGEGHPLTQEILFNALKLYKEAKIAVDSLATIKGNDDYNFCLYYLKGDIYYRILQLVATPEEIPGIFDQTVDAYKQALLVKPRDIDAEINVELLRKNKNALLARGNMFGDQQMKQLIQQGVGSGRKRGNF